MQEIAGHKKDVSKRPITRLIVHLPSGPIMALPNYGAAGGNESNTRDAEKEVSRVEQ